MYSVIINNVVCDFHYKRLSEYVYAFFAGDHYMGQLFNFGSLGWSAVSSQPNDICPVDGFKSRHKAAEFLLKIYSNFK